MYEEILENHDEEILHERPVETVQSMEQPITESNPENNEVNENVIIDNEVNESEVNENESNQIDDPGEQPNIPNDQGDPGNEYSNEHNPDIDPDEYPEASEQSPYVPGDNQNIMLPEAQKSSHVDDSKLNEILEALALRDDVPVETEAIITYLEIQTKQNDQLISLGIMNIVALGILTGMIFISQFMRWMK